MPNFEIIKRSTAIKTFRVASVIDGFDIKSETIEERFRGSIDIEGLDWNVGLIVGASGTGKSTIAEQVFGEEAFALWPQGDGAVIDSMPARSFDEITGAFNSVGFSSPHSWIKPYSVLSNGERMRVDLAYNLLGDSELFVFDEFTSVVDRTVAKIGSLAIQKNIRDHNKKFVAVSCHYDIIEWLMPDWVFNTDRMEFESGLKKKTKN